MNYEWKTLSEKELKRTVLTIEENASVLLPLLHSPVEGTVMEIFQKPFSHLKLCYLHNGTAVDKATSHPVFILRIHLERGARLESCFVMAGRLSSRLFLETWLEEEESSVYERTIYFGSGEQIFDMCSNTFLKAPHTTTEILSKGILTDHAQARFDGNIHIQQTAKKSTGRLIEHTLLLSPEAKMNAIPGLKIDTNDVVASHSASVTRVDEEQLFYASSRGMGEHDAIRLMAQGFLESCYRGLPWEKEIENVIQMKLCRW